MLTQEAKNQLKAIMRRDYGAVISDEKAEELGVSLLRLTRTSITVLARAEDKESSVQASAFIALDPKTGM